MEVDLQSAALPLGEGAGHAKASSLQSARSRHDFNLIRNKGDPRKLLRRLRA
jgi:hypothetical protein